MIQYTGTKINITRFYLVLDIQLVFCLRRELDLYRNYIHLHFSALIMQTCVIFSKNYFNLNVSPCYLTTLREGNLIFPLSLESTFTHSFKKEKTFVSKSFSNW
jgi:hypothetical protein